MHFRNSSAIVSCKFVTHACLDVVLHKIPNPTYKWCKDLDHFMSMVSHAELSSSVQQQLPNLVLRIELTQSNSRKWSGEQIWGCVHVCTTYMHISCTLKRLCGLGIPPWVIGHQIKVSSPSFCLPGLFQGQTKRPPKHFTKTLVMSAQHFLQARCLS